MAESPESFWKVRDYIRNQAPKGTIISERELARKFRLSRYVTKSVLSALETEGVVRCMPQRGYEIIDYSETDDATLLKVRCVLEADAIRLAAERATDDDIRQLTMIMEDLRKALAENDCDRYRPFDYEFHRALVVASHDPMFLKIFDTMFGMKYRSQPNLMEMLAITHQDHEDMLQAIIAKDKDRAELAIYRHLGLTLSRGINIVERISDELTERMEKIDAILMRDQKKKRDPDTAAPGSREKLRAIARITG